MESVDTDRQLRVNQYSKDPTNNTETKQDVNVTTGDVDIAKSCQKPDSETQSWGKQYCCLDAYCKLCDTCFDTCCEECINLFCCRRPKVSR